MPNILSVFLLRLPSLLIGGVLTGLSFYFPQAQAADFAKLATLASQRYGEQAYHSIIELQATMKSLESASDMDKLEGINQFFNRKIKYFDSDINIWGQSDYWATPLESLGKERGDCEDYSIAKYLFLRELDIPDEKLKLTYVKAKIGGPYSKISQAHMVLTYYATPNAEPLVLDNLISEIRPASRRPDLTPIFSFNSQGLWVGNSSDSKGDPTSHLSRWRNLLARVHSDGID
ncbi:MAG TPA: transglutaminase-like cysteine peptidase [Methylophilaceae bacterium]|nr:transglutaminase-like cysteine peptidase [Methylophilaceae bacterium]